MVPVLWQACRNYPKTMENGGGTANIRWGGRSVEGGTITKGTKTIF
jgi:hypothetical protein